MKCRFPSGIKIFTFVESLQTKLWLPDYVTYSCSESSYKGKIGFVVEEGRRVIRQFPTTSE